ncbi:MAG: DUF4010 domain-containing protein [Betaproteobacteria bacterium]|nr:DUF4010 domain-containing protein [Betaproteobacteria bacterium]MDH4292734.1 DUF4010 domain-containing protein [Betaproteobacteria bacterium]
MSVDEQNWYRIAIALGIGLLIGIERERRKGEGPQRAVAGMRTFAVVALLGAVSVILGDEVLLAVVAAGVTLLVAIGYRRTFRGDPGLTTEIALLLTLLLGALAMSEPPLAAGLAAGIVVLLAARSRMHHFAKRILTEREFNDALVLAAATLVVLPLIPDRYIGPYAAFNPRITWTIVVVMLAIGAAGHVALRVFGPRYGLAVAGLASGFVSSAATVSSMGERAQQNPALLRAAVAGAVLSNVSTILQMAAVLAVTSLATLRAMALPLLLAGAAAVAYGALLTYRAVREPADYSEDRGRAFSFRTALLFALSVSAIMFAAAAIVAWMGTPGLALAAAVTGFADAHATAVSAASLAGSQTISAAQATIPILLGLTSNTITKIVVAIVNGGGRYAGQVIPGLLLTIAAAWLGWVVAG